MTEPGAPCVRPQRSKDFHRCAARPGAMCFRSATQDLTTAPPSAVTYNELLLSAMDSRSAMGRLRGRPRPALKHEGWRTSSPRVSRSSEKRWTRPSPRSSPNTRRPLAPDEPQAGDRRRGAGGLFHRRDGDRPNVHRAANDPDIPGAEVSASSYRGGMTRRAFRRSMRISSGR